MLLQSLRVVLDLDLRLSQRQEAQALPSTHGGPGLKNMRRVRISMFVVVRAGWRLLTVGVTVDMIRFGHACCARMTIYIYYMHIYKCKIYKNTPAHTFTYGSTETYDDNKCSYKPDHETFLWFLATTARRVCRSFGSRGSSDKRHNSGVPNCEWFATNEFYYARSVILIAQLNWRCT